MCPNNRGSTFIRVRGAGPPAPSGGQRWARVGWLKRSRMSARPRVHRRPAGGGGRGARTPPPPRARRVAAPSPQRGRRGARPAAGPTRGSRDGPQVARGTARHRGGEPHRRAGRGHQPAALGKARWDLPVVFGLPRRSAQTTAAALALTDVSKNVSAVFLRRSGLGRKPCGWRRVPDSAGERSGLRGLRDVPRH